MAVSQFPKVSMKTKKAKGRKSFSNVSLVVVHSQRDTLTWIQLQTCAQANKQQTNKQTC